MLECLVEGMQADAATLGQAVVPCVDGVLRPASQCLRAVGAPARLLHR